MFAIVDCWLAPCYAAIICVLFSLRDLEILMFLCRASLGKRIYGLHKHLIGMEKTRLVASNLKQNGGKAAPKLTGESYEVLVVCFKLENGRAVKWFVLISIVSQTNSTHTHTHRKFTGRWCR